MPLVRRKEARTIMSKREVLGVRYDEIESIHREACSQRKNACDDASIDNHSRSPKTLYMRAAICQPLWIVGSAIGNLRPKFNALLYNTDKTNYASVNAYLQSMSPANHHHRNRKLEISTKSTKAK